MLVVSEWVVAHGATLEVKNLTAVIIHLGDTEYKCYFRELGTERQTINFLWLPQDGNFHSISVYKHYLLKLSLAILNAVDMVLEKKTAGAVSRISGSSQVKLDTYQDFGAEIWRMQFGNLANHKQSQFLKGMKSLRDLIVIAIMLQEIEKNLRENLFLGTDELFSL